MLSSFKVLKIEAKQIFFSNSVDSSTQRYGGELATPRIGDSGESFFEYEYLREFKAKIGTARKVV